MSATTSTTASSPAEFISMEKAIRLSSYRSHYSYMDESLGLLRAIHEADWHEFVTPWGQQKITLVHLAAHSGNLRMLKRAVELNADLNAEDEYKRCALHHAAFKGHLHIIRWLLDQPSGSHQLVLQNSDGNTALHEAIRGLTDDLLRPPDSKWRNVAVVELLVEKGANVNTTNSCGYSPLYLAGQDLVDSRDPNACEWYEKIVEILVSASASVNPVIEHVNGKGTTPLHHAIFLECTKATRQLLKDGACIMEIDVWGNTPLHLAAGSENHELLSILLEKVDRSMIQLENWFRQTPFHCAAGTGHPKNFRAFIDLGENLLTANSKGTTVLHFLFEHCPEPTVHLSNVFDTRVRLEDCSMRVLPADQALILNFDVMLPPDKPQMDIVSALINEVTNTEQMMILQHPLLGAFLLLKWSNYRHFYSIFFIFHVFFLLSLFWYAAVIQKDVDSFLPRRLLLGCAFILLFHNLLQLLTIPRHYVQRFEHWLSMICATTSIGVAVIGEIIPDAMAAATPNTPGHSWLRNSVGVVILLAGIQMMCVIGKFPASGYYTLMFFSVLRNVLKVFLVFICLIFSFAFSFLILLRGQNQFYDPWVAIVKTLVMMTGEFDYSIFLTSNDQGNSTVANINSENTLLPITRGIVFLLFVMLANIVLTNLITALAVTDVQGLVEKGKLLRLKKQAEFTSDFERMTTYWIFSRRWVPDFLKIILENKIPNQMTIQLARPKRHWLRADSILEKVVEKLYTLAEKNRDSAKKSQMNSSRNKSGGDHAEIILYLQKQIRELERRNMDLLEQMQCPIIRNARSDGDLTTAL